MVDGTFGTGRDLVRSGEGHLPLPSGAAGSFEVREWVSSKVYRRGLDYYREGRVVSFEVEDDGTIHAEVDGTELYDVTVSWSGDGEPEAECTCPYDWEPLCKHAVAAILFWQDAAEEGEAGADVEGDSAGDSEDAAGAERSDVLAPECARSFDREAYIRELSEIERKRRRSPKLVDSLQILKAPKGLCGVYAVSSASCSSPYAVTVRDADDLSHTVCNCPDYLVNELGTCKHIEAVKARVARALKRHPRGRRKDPRIWVSLKPRDTYASTVSPYEEIHIHSESGKVRDMLFGGNGRREMPWSEDGYLRENSAVGDSAKAFETALSAVKRCFNGGKVPDIVVSPEVRALVAAMDADRAWRERVDGIIRARGESKAWAELKGEIAVRLYDYQEEGILFAVRNRRSFIGDDMGLGKTVQALAAALLVKKLAGISRVLVFCPASLKYQWKREIERISRERAEIVQGGKRARENLYETSRAMFLIVNYELIFRDEECFHRMAPGMIILDEAQRIKNWETKTAKGIKRLGSDLALVLTGTPFENKLVELQSLCEFLRPRALGPMWRLLPTYGNMDADDRLVGFSNLGGLRLRLAPFFLRREKEMVLSQLPERVTNEYAVEISPMQAKYHDDYAYTLARILARARKRPLTPEEMKRVFMCLTAMRIIGNALAQHQWERYRRVVDVPEPLGLSTIKSFHSPKLLEFRSVMEELIDRPHAKFVIFSQWERMLFLAEAAIRDLLMEREMEAVIFSGSLSSSARPGVIDRFINDPRLRVFFSTDAGGLGLNLQESASYVINLEMPWNPAVLEQRIGRVHRLGQKNTVNVINFISTGCVEERVCAAVSNKRALFDGLFDGKSDSVDFEKGPAFIDRLREIMGDFPAEPGRRGGRQSPQDLEEALVPEGEVSTPTAREGDGEAPGLREAVPSRGALAGGRSGGKDRTAESAPAASETPSGAGGGQGRRDIDITGILKAVGAWLGNREMTNVPQGSFKVSVESADGEVRLSIRKPPAEIAAALQGALANLAGMMG